MISQKNDDLVTEFRVIKGQSTDEVFPVMLNYEKALGCYWTPTIDMPKNPNFTGRGLSSTIRCRGPNGRPVASATMPHAGVLSKSHRE
jgi:hypothetical protein